VGYLGVLKDMMLTGCSLTGAVQAVWKNTQSAAAGTEESNLPVYHLRPGQIIVPGLAGASAIGLLKFRSELVKNTDAHAHVLGWGYKMQLPLDGSQSVDGEFFTHQ
jgi:hypothetical protein